MRYIISFDLKEFCMTDEKQILKEKDAARYISMSRSYLRQDRMNGIRENRTPGPTFVRINRSIRYLKEDLDTWLKINRVERSCPAYIVRSQASSKTKKYSDSDFTFLCYCLFIILLIQSNNFYSSDFISFSRLIFK